MENQGLEGATQLEDALASAGFLPRDVTMGDQHASAFRSRGWQHDDGSRLWRMTRDGTSGRRFPMRRTSCSEGELEFARHTNERTRRATSRHNFEPVAAAGRWRLLDGDAEVLPGDLGSAHAGTRAIPPGGAWFETGGETLRSSADLIPTTAHLPLPWIMGYDLEPLRTLESKRTLAARMPRRAAGG